MSDTQVNNGVNVEALLGAREALEQAPEAAQFKWRTSCEWVNGTHSKSQDSPKGPLEYTPPSHSSSIITPWSLASSTNWYEDLSDVYFKKLYNTTSEPVLPSD